VANTVKLSKGAVEPAAVSPAGNAMQAWKGAVEPSAPFGRHIVGCIVNPGTLLFRS